MDRKQLLLDSVRKLLALNVSDKEIILNLKDVGINQEQAQALLDEARGKKPKDGVLSALEGEAEDTQEEALEEESEEAGEEEAQEESEEEVAEQVVSEAEEEEEPEKEEEPEPVQERPKRVIEVPQRQERKDLEEIKRRAVEKALEKHELQETHEDLGKLWEKGILATANQSLQEMKKIRTDLNKILDEKVAAETEKELKKVKTLQESQQVLIMHKMDSALQKKADDVNEQIDAKIKELSKASREIQLQIEKLESKKQLEKSLFDQLSQKLVELEKQKQSTVSSFNSELIKARSAVQEMLDDAGKKIDEIDARANKTLELESTVAEGLIKDAKSRIEQLSIDKSKELENELKKELEDIEALESKIKPEELKQKLKEIENAKAEMQKTQKLQFEQQKEREKEAQKKLQSKLGELEALRGESQKKLQSGLEELDAIKDEMQKNMQSKLDELNAIKDEIQRVEKLQPALQKEREAEMEKKMGERLEEYVKYLQDQAANLDTFKQQFIKVIEANVDKFNKSVSQINDTLAKFEEQQNARMKLIDSKIQELDDFEKKFAEEMEISVEKYEKLPKKKKNKKGKN